MFTFTYTELEADFLIDFEFHFGMDNLKKKIKLKVKCPLADCLWNRDSQVWIVVPVKQWGRRNNDNDLNLPVKSGYVKYCVSSTFDFVRLLHKDRSLFSSHN